MNITSKMVSDILKNFNESHNTQIVYEIVNPNGTTNPKGLKIKNEGNSKALNVANQKQ